MQTVTHRGRILLVLFMLQAGMALGADATAATEKELKFINSRDQTEQLAAVFAPDKALVAKSAPLLIHLHYYDGDRFAARALGYYAQAEYRSWYVLSPELHGDRTKGGKASFASRNAQQDVLDALAAMRAQYPNIDAKRIYLAGRSMGGMLATLMLVKHPDLFAGAVAGAPITDAAALLDHSVLFAEGMPARKALEEELGGTPKTVPFEYVRRSPITFAPNARYAPLVLWSGTNDTWVPMDQSGQMDAAIRKVFPYQPPVHWVVGGNHCSMNYTAAWVCDQLQYFENGPESRIKTPWRYYPELDFVTDESQAFYWVKAEVAKDGALVRVRAALRADELSIEATNAKTLTIDVNNAVGGIAGKAALAKMRTYRVTSDGTLILTFMLDGKELTHITVEKEKSGTLE